MTAKERRSIEALKHYKEMEKESFTSIETTISVQNTALYANEDTPFLSNILNRYLYNTYNTEIEITNMTTCDSLFYKYNLFHNNNQFKIGILDFASFTNPGGGFLKGSLAQEEDLCMNSNLYNILIRNSSFYEQNKNYINNGLYSNRMLYIPHVIFTLDNKWIPADVVVCAAPNMKRYKDNNNYICHESYYDLLLKRIDCILNTFMINNNNVLILGAFGCGVFDNDPVLVSSIFKNLLEVKYKNIFKKIIFAIPKSNKNNNYEIFENTFITK